MRAIVCAEPGRLERIERPAPEPAPGLVAVDVKAVGICGTDFHILEGTHPFLDYPRVMGHELSGVVAGGAGQPASPPARRWSSTPISPAAHCVACRKGKPNCCATLKVLGVHIDGGMCERIVVPEENLYPAGDLSLRDAAMIEFQAIGAHAVRRSALAKGDRVLVVGAGPIGVGAAIFARLAGGEVTLMDISRDAARLPRDRLGFGDTILAGEDALRRNRPAHRRRPLSTWSSTPPGSARAMEASFAFVAQRRHAGLRRRARRRHHLLRPGIPPQGDDPEGDPERHPRRLRDRDGGDARRPRADGRAQHPQRRARRPARDHAGLARVDEPPLKAIVTV